MVNSPWLFLKRKIDAEKEEVLITLYVLYFYILTW